MLVGAAVGAAKGAVIGAVEPLEKAAGVEPEDKAVMAGETSGESSGGNQ